MGERRSNARPELRDARPVVIFDGLCHLCTAVVLFAIPRDPHGRLRFAPLQSDVVRARLSALSAVPQPLPDSFLLLEGDRLSVRSSAALRLVRYLAMPWPLLSVFVLVPRPIRDWVYDLIARRRYQWFGTRETCLIPTPEVQSRFLKMD
jgi:predicted DCC family thiol-disulfide oxidoreductase YuxK